MTRNKEMSLGKQALLKALKGTSPEMDYPGEFQEYCVRQMKTLMTPERVAASHTLKTLQFSFQTKNKCARALISFQKYMREMPDPPEHMKAVFYWLKKFRKSVDWWDIVEYKGDVSKLDDLFKDEQKAFEAAQAAGFPDLMEEREQDNE